MDVIILCATLFVVLSSKTNDTAIEKLRFLQILRLFHIDRQMTTWKLIRKMIKHSKYELISVYYITFIILLFLAVSVYTTENDEEDLWNKKNEWKNISVLWLKTTTDNLTKSNLKV